LAAALAAATRDAAAVGFTAVVEAAALLAVVDDEGLVVAELLDLLSPVPVLVGAVDALGAAPGAGLLAATLLVVAVVVLDTAGLGLALEVELALDGCLDTVVLPLALDLVAGGRGAVEEVGRFGGSDLVSAVLISVCFGLDGMVLGTVGFVVGLAGPFSDGLVARGFLSVVRAVDVKGLVGRFAASVGLVVSAAGFVGLVVLLARPTGLLASEGLGLAPTVEEVGLDPADLGAVVVVGFDPGLAVAPTADLVAVVFACGVAVLLAVGVPALLVLPGLGLLEPADLAAAVGPLGVLFGVFVGRGFSGVGSVVVMLGTTATAGAAAGSGSDLFSFSTGLGITCSGDRALVGVAGVI